MSYSIKGKTVEYKTVSFLVKSVDQDQGIVTGLASPVTNIDQQKDKVEPGSYKKTLTEATSRMKNGRRFMYACLWMHDPMQPTGGVVAGEETPEGLQVTMKYDISTNAAGVPNNPIATMVFSGFKEGYIDELSIGYICNQYEWDKQGVRHLKEIQLIEISAVTMLFAANPEALVPAGGVKSMFVERKTVCGDTSLPIGARDASWDGSAAHNQIVEWATKGDGSIDPAKMKKVHLQCDGDADKITSYGYAFCDIVDGSPQINVGGVKACAAALSGARNADPGEDADGMKKKVATLYSRINAKYPDDPELSPPWEDDGKMSTQGRGRKDFNDVHQAGKAADCLEDWCDLLNDLTQTMFQIFGMSDTPESDMTDCLEQFGEALMKEWLPKAIEANLGQYLNDCGYCSPTSSSYVPYSMQTGADYGYMSRAGRPNRKAGRTISAATQSTLEQHQADMKAMHDELKNQSDDLAAQFKSMINDHVQAAQQKVSDLTQLWNEEGLGDPYTNDKSRVSRREPPARRTLTPARKTQPPQSTVSDEAIADLTALFS